jgi:hypothetical protein
MVRDRQLPKCTKVLIDGRRGYREGVKSSSIYHRTVHAPASPWPTLVWALTTLCCHEMFVASLSTGLWASWGQGGCPAHISAYGSGSASATETDGWGSDSYAQFLPVSPWCMTTQSLYCGEWNLFFCPVYVGLEYGHEDQKIRASSEQDLRRHPLVLLMVLQPCDLTWKEQAAPSPRRKNGEHREQARTQLRVQSKAQMTCTWSKASSVDSQTCERKG